MKQIKLAARDAYTSRIYSELLIFLRTYLAENNCTDEFLPELHSSGVLDMMPELSKVIQIFRRIPATSCSSKRSLSNLKRIKTLQECHWPGQIVKRCFD